MMREAERTWPDLQIHRLVGGKTDMASPRDHKRRTPQRHFWINTFQSGATYKGCRLKCV